MKTWLSPSLADTLQRLDDSMLADVRQQMQQLANSFCAPFDEAFGRWRAMEKQFADSILAPLDETFGRWKRAMEIVCAELPKRGWYLTGEEPINLIEQLAQLADKKDWPTLDKILVKHAAQFTVKYDVLQQWLAQEGVPPCCRERVRLVLENWELNNHEITTIVGLAVIDELCCYLYDGRSFTTKRHNQPRPQLACQTVGARALRSFERKFVEEFGSIQKDVDMSRLSDDDYFNRHAILHGKMRRSYGPKDSAKVFMVLMFLVFGRGDADAASDAQ